MSKRDDILIIKPSFKFFVVDILSVVLCFIVAILLCFSPFLGLTNYYIAGIMVFVGCGMFFLVANKVKAYSFTVTNEAVLVRYHFFFVERIAQIPLEMVSGVAVNQNLLEKILKIAHVDIFSISSPLKPLTFFGIDKPEQTARYILDKRKARIEQINRPKPTS